MIDWAQARQLQEDVGKEEMAEVVELFLSEVDEAMETLQNGYDTIPAEDRAAAFHFLKGCASNLGFKTFGDQCSLGEEVTKGGGAFRILKSQILLPFMQVPNNSLLANMTLSLASSKTLRSFR